MKNLVYVKDTVFTGNTQKSYFFIFKKSECKHLKLKKFAGKNSFYWFQGLTGSSWYRGGWFISPLINPSANILNNIQGFTDGNNVYLLKRISEDMPKNIIEY